MKNFCLIKFSRGTGLGNRLFPWVRAIIYAKNNDCHVLAPSWGHLRRGPLLRSNLIMGGIAVEDFLGKILLFNNFSNLGYLTGLNKIFHLYSKKIINENDIFIKTFDGEIIIRFKGDKNFLMI